ncbi:serine/threonine protein kinase [Campylobacter novaezeelandiae]|uniref:Serine/threonine protein kinase n=1 Tax=Campylobacter novaezeelandiae TaxID=2267891 RepID=A0A4Q9JWP7_9BACT|nr:serine/threonine protein kinase [Campylobacter novaezeelandiae]MBK1964388.1 serine/threonine protein kinase [Campylobacter novaezeelandiae]MBK1993352.1 serine/threonine protein kinase [Campylobacter novaezeelandiae]QWU80060.1 L-serine transporter [Campylobacter novaezeelandiae]TBR79023.1 serine/threonine protein kinase [Campylobacter novaezeelandiae]TBR81622.1 serine/threonine protein kinase [Campylobacter novaezeelandiae]
MNSCKLTGHDLRWILSLFGTAIGAGVLFLPINAGLGGLFPLLVILVLAYPMTYLAHRNLSRFVLSSSNPRDDITFVAETYFGKGGGFLITLLYFFAILPILLVYSANLTTTLIEFLINQIGMEAEYINGLRLVISFFIVAGLMLVSILGEGIVTKAMSLLVFPFILMLVVISLFLIPHWNGAIFQNISFSSLGEANFWVTLWLVVPVMVFSFNHSPIISSLACFCKKEYGDQAEAKASKIISRSVMLMVVVVMFFVFSCALCLTPEDFTQAKTQNVNILTYIANRFPEAVFLAYIAPIIALVAMSKSFLGHYLGSQEGLNGVLYKISDGKIQGKIANTITGIFTFLIAWFVAYKNPSAIGIIESIGGPVLAILLFLMPVYCIYRFDLLKKFRSKGLDIFIVIIGLIAISAAIHGLLS